MVNPNPEFDIRHSVLVGESSDIYLQRTLNILRHENVNPTVTMEYFPRKDGVICGLKEVKDLLSKVLPESGSEIWTLEEGEPVNAKEVALRVKAPYSSFGLYETAICGILASCTGWATAARECVEAAQGTPVVAMAARHIHPNVAANIDYSSIVGGCVACSTSLGARLAGVTPSGSMPHVLPLLMGDTVKSTEAFDQYLPQDVPRIALVDTFKDEVEEALNVARALKEKLRGVRLDTASERGGVTQELVKELRVRLDLNGFNHVEIFVSGGFTAAKINEFMINNTPVNGFGVGSYISDASPNDFTADIHEIGDQPVAKKGRIPGITANPRLRRVM